MQIHANNAMLNIQDIYAYAFFARQFQKVTVNMRFHRIIAEN